jgi:hypothetical protein
MEKDSGHVVWKFRGKGSKEREVPLWKKARRIFEAYMADRPESPWIFPNQTNTNHIRTSVIQEACRHLATLDPSLSKLTAHVLRHTFATMAILNCHDVKRVQAILGHGKKNAVRIPVVMLRYMHPEVANNNASNRAQHSKSRAAAAKSNPAVYAEDCAPCQESKMRRARKNSVLSYPLSNEDMFFGQYEIGPFGGQYPVPVTRRNPASKSTKAQRGRMFIRISDTAGDGYSDYGKKLKALRGKVVEVDTAYLFDNQYSTKDHDLRVMDRDVVEVINDQRRGRTLSHWSHKHAPTHHAEKAFAGERAAASAYAAERGFPVGKLYKKMHARKEKEAAWGAWKSLGTIRRVFKNGNFLLASGERILRAYYTGKPVVGHKLFESPDGSRMVAASAQDLKDYAKRRVSKRNPAVSFKTKDGRSVSFKSKSNPRSRRNAGEVADFSRELSMFDYHAPQFEQTVGQFSVTEAFTHGLQPANRRNPRKKSHR